MAVYSYPHTEVNIYDNSAVTYPSTAVLDGTKQLFVIMSPRGIDGKLTLIKNGLQEFIAKFGMGDSSIYGQPILNAYHSIGTGKVSATVLRVTAKNSRLANLYVYAAYKITAGEANAAGTMTVKFVTATDTALVTKDKLGAKAQELKPTVEGYTVVFMFAYCSLGRGVYGNNIGVRLSTNARYDKENAYKNYYLQVYDDNTKSEEVAVSFYDNAVTSTATLYADAVVNDPDTGSSLIALYTDPAGPVALAAAYKTAVFDKVSQDQLTAYAATIGMTAQGNDAVKALMQLDSKTFDAFLGINKNLVGKVTDSAKTVIYNYTIEASGSADNVVTMSDLTGVDMKSGSDGDFDISTDSTTRTAAIQRAYLDAFAPDSITADELEADNTAGNKRAYDPYIYSRTRYPLNIIYDANYPNSVKKAIAALAVKRGDCEACLDLGTGFTAKTDILDRISALDTVTTDRLNFVDGYEMKIRDPYSHKIVSVTPTYWLSYAYPNLFDGNGGKHVALAGANGTISMAELVSDSIFPVFDEDIDSAIMAQLAAFRVNYAQINPKGTVIRATQSTRQEAVTALSEINNMFIVLDVKRDCERLCGSYNYNFLDNTDLSTFNRDAEQLLANYHNQVKSISASFSSTSAEQEQGVLHLSVELVNKKLIKTAIVDIHINK